MVWGGGRVVLVGFESFRVGGVRVGVGACVDGFMRDSFLPFRSCCSLC